MNKKLSLLAVSALAASAMAQEGPSVSFSGYLDADMAGYKFPDSDSLQFQSNQELDLTSTIKFSDKVKVDLYASTYTTLTDENGNTIYHTVPAQGGDVTQRWTGFAFDGLTATLETDAASIMVGDLAVTDGGFKYYFYKRTIGYASVLPEMYMRGVGVTAYNATIMAGASDLSASTFDAYVNYNLVLGESSVKPFFFFSSDQTDSYMAGGLSATVAAGNTSTNATVGYLQDPDMDPTFTFLVEPSATFGKASVAATAYYAMIDDKKPSATSVPEDMFFYVEPGYSISDEFAVGLPLEYHSGDTDPDSKMETAWVVPTFYVYPASGVEWWIWGQAVVPVGDDAGDDMIYGFGSELIARF